MKPIPFRPVVLLVLALLSATTVKAAPDSETEPTRAATAKLIELLVEQGVITRDKAEALLKELSKPANSPPPVRVPYMPEFMRQELKDEVKLDLAAQAAREGWAKAGSVPTWVRNITWDGDLRTRYQVDSYGSGNAPAAFFTDVNATNRAGVETPVDTTTDDRRRFRVRARAGLTARLDDNWSAGLRLTTGSLSNPVSSNQTLGNYGERFTTAFDRAYIRLRAGDDVNAVVGRFGNPWFGTDLVWASDLGFDGVAVQWTPALTPSVRGFATVAAMPVQEVELSANDKWLYGVQVGATWPSSADSFGAKLGLGYYRYTHIVGEANAAGTNFNDHTAVLFAQKGNTYFNISGAPAPAVLLGLASDYHLVDLTAQLDFPAGADKRVVLSADYVRNIGFDRAAVSERAGTDVAPETTGYQLRLAYGNASVKKLHDWQAFVAYKRLERDAVLDAYTASDFHLGGTDAKGYILGGSYGVGKNVAASLRYFSADSISGYPLAIDVLQLDLSVQF